MAIEILPCLDSRRRERLLAYPFSLYRDDPLWVPPPQPLLRARIDPARGGFFRRGEAAFWLAVDGGRTVGTIAAACDGAANRLRGTREASFGFFEYADPMAASALVETAAAWARGRGLDSLVGPFNLDAEDAYGVLVDGRDRPPALLCGHSRPYYADTMAALGFVPARADNIALELRIDPPSNELLLLSVSAPAIQARQGFSIRSVDFGRLDREVGLVRDLMNGALAHLPDYHPVHRAEVRDMVAGFKGLADPELILFAEKDGRCLGFLPALPNLNEIWRRVGGLRRPWHWAALPFAWLAGTRSLSVKSILVAPDWWGRGLGPCLIGELYRRVSAKGYRWVDLSLTGVDNSRSVSLAKRLGATVYKTYRVYRKDLAPPRSA